MCLSLPDVHIILEEGRVALDKLRHYSGAGAKVGVEVVEIVEVHVVHALTNEKRVFGVLTNERRVSHTWVMSVIQAAFSCLVGATRCTVSSVPALTDSIWSLKSRLW